MKINKGLLTVIAVSVVGGVLAGYGIWGTKEKKEMNVGQLLEEALKGVELMEKNNRDLTEAIEKSKADVQAAEGRIRENQDLKTQLQKARDDMKEWENRVTELNATLAEAEKRATVAEERKAADSDRAARISELEKETQVLSEQLRTVGEKNTILEGNLSQVRAELSDTKERVKAGEELKTLSADLQSKVTALEAENTRLRSILEKIDQITKEKEANGKVKQ